MDGGQGVDVYGNGGDINTYYQCVELPQRRLYPKFGWPTVWAAGNGGAYMIPEGSPGLIRHNPGSGYLPVPGDLIIENPVGEFIYGHVAVVDFVSGNTIYAVEQNGSNDGRATYTYNNSNYGGGFGSIKAIMHAPQNNFKNPGTTPPPPPGPAGSYDANALTNASFENSSAGWGRINQAAAVNYTVYKDKTFAREGAGYLEMNTSVARGSVGQNVAVSTTPGQSYTFSAWVRSRTSTPVSGTLTLWGLGGTQESGTTDFTVGPTWTLVSAPLDVTKSGHTTLRAEIYLSTTGANFDVDGATLASGNARRSLAPASPPSPPPGSTGFPDVSANYPYRTAILGMAGEGVISGYPDGTFRPLNPLWRAQFAKMICGAVGLTVLESMSSPFTDLGADDPSSLYTHEYIAAAYNNGITLGTGQGRFSPWQDIPRAQVITMVVRAAKNLHPGLLQTPPSGWTGAVGNFDPTHGQNLIWAEYNGLLAGLQGYGAGWNPWQKMTRGEVSQVLWNLMQK